MIKFQYKFKNNKIISLEPTKIIVFSFAAVIFWGAMLLTLPISSNPGQPPVNFLTALFTATSATCVTGLIVVDTATQWSTFGRTVIILLIQIGGLGFITFATFFSVLLGRKVGIKGMVLAQESLNHFSFEGVLRLIKKVVSITFLVELVGAIIFSTRFIPYTGSVPKGIYMAVFQSISSFCNAGFDLVGGYRSLTVFNNDPIVLLTTATLIIFGGLGFIVWKDLYEYRKTKKLLVHTKVVLVFTTILLLSGTLLFFVFEYNNPATLGGLNTQNKLLNAYFQSVTLRTAGFNSIPVLPLNEITKVGNIILMFIGAAPGSTGGGVKVTTFGIIIAAILSQIKGSDETILFKHKVPHNTVNKSLSIIGLSLTLVVTVTTLLLAVEANKFSFIDTLYEVTSAFGTVGISSFGTPALHTVSRIAVIITMFLGRVGPLSFALALTLRNSKKNEDQIYPESKIVVG
ncbi:MAG: Ktr system potassium uptake protein B [Firmicutes bacterium ADurb.Bin419]|nr:MAG: Ktr system potassium uptake protein B [Firmicutes bacterium ADurb.Bin419]